MSFPRQVKKENLFEALQKFYKSVDRNLVETYKEFDDDRDNINEGKLDEVQFNQKEFRRVISEIKSGKEKVTVRWYSADIVGGAEKRLNNKINEFQLNYRYGKWFREENVIT